MKDIPPYVKMDIHQAVEDLFAFLEEHPEMEEKLKITGETSEAELVEVHLAFLKWLETKKQRN